MSRIDLTKIRQYELPAFVFRKIPLKSWDSVGTMVYNYLLGNLNKVDGYGTDPILEIMSFDFNRIHRHLSFKIRFNDLDFFEYKVQYFLDLIAYAYTSGATIEHYYQKRVGDEVFKKVGIGIIDRAFYINIHESKSMFGYSRKDEDYYIFANGYYRYSTKLPQRVSKWTTTKRLREFILKAADKDKNEIPKTHKYPAYDSEEYAMKQMFSEINYIYKIIGDMKKDHLFRNADFPKEMEQ